MVDPEDLFPTRVPGRARWAMMRHRKIAKHLEVLASKASQEAVALSIEAGFAIVEDERRYGVGDRRARFAGIELQERAKRLLVRAARLSDRARHHQAEAQTIRFAAFATSGQDKEGAADPADPSSPSCNFFTVRSSCQNFV